MDCLEGVDLKKFKSEKAQLWEMRERMDGVFTRPAVKDMLAANGIVSLLYC